MYCCFSREPHSLWSMLKEIPVADSAAEYSLTGIDTMPKETVAVAIARGAIMRPPKRACIYTCDQTRARGQVRGLPRQARGGAHSGAFRRDRSGAAGALRRPETRGPQPSFRLPAGAGRGAGLLGRPEGTVAGPGG